MIRTTETITHELHRAEGKLAWKRETGQVASAKAFEAIVAALQNELEAAKAADECPDCGGDGWVEVRRPELDNVVMAEAWEKVACTCEAGEAWQWEAEERGFEAEEWAREGDYFRSIGATRRW